MFVYSFSNMNSFGQGCWALPTFSTFTMPIFGSTFLGGGFFNTPSFWGFNSYNFSNTNPFANNKIENKKSVFRYEPNTYTQNTPKIFKYEKPINSCSTKEESYWKSLGYNGAKGECLANYALSNAQGFTGYCARSVKTAIANTGLGNYEYGHACDMPSILRKNSNFREISPDGVNVKDLPAGCILVYDKGAAGYSKQYGHTEITTGDGRAVSDGITRNLHKKPTAIFIPVAA